MSATITSVEATDQLSLTPDLVLGYEASSASGTVVHEVLGGGIRFTFGPAKPRIGTLELFYASRTDAWQGFYALRTAQLFHLEDPDLPELDMNFAVTGELSVALDEETRNRWVVRMPFTEGPS